MSDEILRMRVDFEHDAYGFAIVLAVQTIVLSNGSDRFEIAPPREGGKVLFGRSSLDLGRHAKVTTLNGEHIRMQSSYGAVEVFHKQWSMVGMEGPITRNSDPRHRLTMFRDDLKHCVDDYWRGEPRVQYIPVCNSIVDTHVTNGRCGLNMVTIEPFRKWACPHHGLTAYPKFESHDYLLR